MAPNCGVVTMLGMINLIGRRALVCGSSQGIGRACAELLATQGASVTLMARDAAGLEKVRTGLARGAGQQHGALVADFTQPKTVQSMAASAVAQDGPFDILVNNTGGPSPGPILSAETSALLRAFEMHVICNQLLAQTLIPGMQAQRYGRIIQIISTSVKEPIPGLGVSNTTRWAVAAWAKTLSREVAPHGITVNNVLPGFTATARLTELFEARAARDGNTAAEQEAQTLRSVPMGRFAAPEEIAAAVVFLASPAASYITGVSLAVDGGRLGTM